MATRWYKEKKQEHFYKAAKQTGYRARSAFKLLQIQNKFKIIKDGDIVIDLGAAPGGWSQVTKELTGTKGQIIGIDLSPIRPLEGVTFLQGDMTKEESIQKIKDITMDKKADVIISDMSPNISGNYSIDQATSVYLCEQALKTCDFLLKQDGNFVCKVFAGEDLKDFIKKVNNRFRFVKQYSPEASRKTSSETYVIAKLFKKK